jgi:leucyl aminopeptidase
MSRNEAVSSLQLAAKSWLLAGGPQSKGRQARIIVWGEKKDPANLKQKLKLTLPAWQWKESGAQPKTVSLFTGKDGPVWWVRPHQLGADDKPEGHGGQLNLTPYTRGRDTTGTAVGAALESGAKSIKLEFWHCEAETVRGGIFAAEVAGYSFKRIMAGKAPPAAIKILVDGKPADSQLVAASVRLAQGTNIARHLTNLPSNLLNPDTFPEALKALFKGKKNCTVDVWPQAKLGEEKMNLLLAVGSGSATPPRFIHLKYRPKSARKTKPVAFVGKGITFDTGGLNLKPDSNMRWMKKDIGGAAAVTGLAWWVCSSGIETPCDFYLAVAENAVSGNAFRPGDVIEARSGTKVEIHNTDAEGRLVLADALDVAAESDPQLIVDVATLTGAIKVGLGSAVAGLFGNSDDHVRQMAKAAQETGDWMWAMPLFRKYKSALKSSAGDIVNAGDGFGGAITAAIFLENFIGKSPWLHLDIYAWKDSAEGPWAEPGASGQPVQALAKFLENF